MKKRLVVFVFTLAALLTGASSAHALGIASGALAAPHDWRQAVWGSTPRSIAGLVGWWRSDLGVLATGGTTVNGWCDLTSSNFDLVGSATKPSFTAVDATWNNRPSLGFAGAAGMTGANVTNATQPDTIFIVANWGATAVNSIWLDGATTRQALIWNGTNVQFYAGTTVITSTSATKSFSIFAMVMNGASSLLYQNTHASTIASGNPGVAALKGLLVGIATNPSTGSLVEILIYSSALTATQVGTIFAYAGTRYSQSWS
jgi:hypothetical protein